MKDLLQCEFQVPKEEVIKALEGSKIERVAVLTFARIGDKVTINGVVPLSNTHRKPASNYEVPAHQLRVFNRNTVILAHSHPNPKHKPGPSAEDMTGLSMRYGAVYVPDIKLLVLYTRNATRTLSLR